MEIGAHLPAYLFCEQLVSQGRVLDIWPPDGRGPQLLARTAASVTIVEPSRTRFTDLEDAPITRIIGHTQALPFARESFDFVIHCPRGKGFGLATIEAFLKSARSLVRQTGLLALCVPNRDFADFDGQPDRELPDFFDFERALRRHFPHVTLFAGRPLRGGIFRPIGRRETSSAPLLDDRLLPADGEMPSHYLALCSPRYRKVDESMIALLPYGALVERVREAVEQLEGKITVSRRESELRLKDLARLETRLAELGEIATELEVTRRGRMVLEQRLAEAERLLALRDRLLNESEKSAAEQAARSSAVEQELIETRSRARRAEQRMEDFDLLVKSGVKEREDADAEREKALREARTARAELKAKQRELDDSREAHAGLEADLGERVQEIQRFKRDLLAERERTSGLEGELAVLRERSEATADRSAEVDRVRSVLAGERERFERRLAEDQRRIVDLETSLGSALEERSIARAAADERVAELEERLKRAAAERDAARNASEDRRAGLDKQTAAVTRERDEARRAAEGLERRLAELRGERDALDRERIAAKQALDELERVVKGRADEIARMGHQIEIVKARAERAEQRAAELEGKVRDLHRGLEQTEADLHTLRAARIDAQSVATRAQNAEDKRAALELEVARLERELALKEKERAGAAARLDESSRMGDEVGGKLLAADERLRTLEGELALAKDEIERRREEVDRANERAAAAGAKIKGGEECITELEEALTTARETELKASEDLGAALEECSAAHDEIGRLEKALKESESERRAMESEVRRLTEEMEHELIKVREDLEVELRNATTSLEARQGEIWELREEGIRLRAQLAATAAAQDGGSRENDLMRTISVQEALIADLTEERASLRRQQERSAQSREKRKKNLRLLANLLKRKRAERAAAAAPAGVALKPALAAVEPGAMWNELDLSALLEEVGSELGDDAIDDIASDDDRDTTLTLGAAKPFGERKKP